jgi:glycosyltransferase involved in cell wall biosynthesis
VPVTSTFAGPALLYRLLQNYPTSRLRIVESDLWSPLPQWGGGSPDKRLPKVTYEILDVGRERLLRSRASLFYSPYLHFTAQYRSASLLKTVEEFQPEAILTVGYGYSWLTAAALARKHDLPLHFIVHDDWPTCSHLPKFIQRNMGEQFGQVYRMAHTRFCVSPFMAEMYEKRYGARGIVLYPSRAADAPEFEDPPSRVTSELTAPTFAYVGSINSRGYAKCLVSLASVLRQHNGKLFVYSGLTEEGAGRFGLNRPNIVIKDMILPKDLIGELRAKVDVLVVAVDFEVDRVVAESNFPSKLTDSTAAGLPLLIFGPSYCSAVRWARENPGVAEVVTENDTRLLSESVRRLVSKPKYRKELGATALAMGGKYFSNTEVTEIFHKAIKEVLPLSESSPVLVV